MIHKQSLTINWSEPVQRKNIPPGTFFVRGKQSKSLYLATNHKTKQSKYYHLSIPINNRIDIISDYKLFALYTWDTCYVITNLKLSTSIIQIEI